MQTRIDVAQPKGNSAQHNVCGVLVHIDPDKSDTTRTLLEQIPGLEIHNRSEDNRLVVTIEDTETSKAINGLSTIHTTPGVIAAALVYHHFEPDVGAGSPDRG